MQVTNLSNINFNRYNSSALDNRPKGIMVDEGLFYVKSAKDCRYLATNGVQTCTALFVYDEANKVGGLAHFNTSHKGLISNCINDLIQKVAGNESSLRYHLVGGYYVSVCCGSGTSNSVADVLSGMDISFEQYKMPVDHPFEMAHPYIDLETGEFYPDNYHKPLSNLNFQRECISNRELFFSYKTNELSRHRRRLIPMKNRGVFVNPSSMKASYATESELSLYKILDMDDEASMTKTIQSIENLLKDKTD
ncbi:MAG: hypothetical protein VXX85_05510 [Candidatus Margulisiibacteriota bacterium]|nr:hypothetical protein [Candidatus Margulisiibacteriota bacterium]